MMFILKTVRQIDGIRKSCQIVAHVLSKLRKEVKEGVTTVFLNNLAEDLCFARGGIPGFKGYRNFPFSICASKNEEVVHGFPNNIPLRKGDILSIDFGVLYKGWYGDSAFTVPVGNVSPEISKIITVGKECLEKAIDIAGPYCRLGSISNAIQRHAENNNYSIIKQFVGHGIGKNLHEDPQIPNYGEHDRGLILRPGTVIAIEPMIAEGTHEVETLEDGWTTITKDRKLSVHFEHTIAITTCGVEILTNRN